MSHEPKDSSFMGIKELLKQGYAETGDINLELAEEGLCADEEALSLAESVLTECE